MTLRSLRERTRWGAASAIAARGIGSFVLLALTVTLGQMSGARVIGIYFLYLSWMNVLATLCALGFSLYVLRHVALLEAVGRSEEAKGLVFRGLRWVATAGLLLIIAAYLFRTPIGAFLLDDVKGPMVLMVAAVGGAGMAILRVLAEGLKARERVGYGLGVEFVLVPGGVLLAIGVLGRASVPIDESVVLVAHVLAVTAAIILAAWIMAAGWSRVRADVSAVRLSSLSTYWAITLANYTIAAAPYFVLPHVATATDIGRFAVVHRLVGLAGTINIALASFFGPEFAKLRAVGDQHRLRKAYRKSQLASILAFVPLYLVFAGFGDVILLGFGDEFREGAAMLMVMATGRIVNAGAGVPDYFLSMTGMEGWDLLGAVGTLVIFGALMLVFGGGAGAMGVAWGFTIAFAARSLYSLALVRRSLATQQPVGKGVGAA